MYRCDVISISSLTVSCIYLMVYTLLLVISTCSNFISWVVLSTLIPLFCSVVSISNANAIVRHTGSPDSQQTVGFRNWNLFTMDDQFHVANRCNPTCFGNC